MSENHYSARVKIINLAGLKITAESKTVILRQISERLQQGYKTFITTPYSEFLLAARRDPKVLDTLNRSDIAIADGIGVIWAAKYLSLRLTARSRWLRFIQAIWQMKYTGASILLKPRYVYSIIPEKIVGADFAWDLAGLAEKNNWSVYLLGGFDDTSARVAEIFRRRYPKLTVHESNKNPENKTSLEDIKAVKPDILMVAYGPIRQEQWIVDNWAILPVKAAIGLGGTFDYIAGKRSNPPRLVRYTGLEWLFRLFTQPKRAKRIYRATFGLIGEMIRYKLTSNKYQIKNST
ncbi:MAG: WecB/TagA/CpsF family glycosyltransferase [Patescibacteria group bacterium]|jgi:N-acetylglucosaminyldiphosphoundecaprenol N-acetyl-beta-D-mannosaminyltransferase